MPQDHDESGLQAVVELVDDQLLWIWVERSFRMWVLEPRREASATRRTFADRQIDDKGV
jgi:hypothetical protein